MRRPRPSMSPTVLLSLLVLFLANAPRAVRAECGPAAGSIGIFFDEAATQTWKTVEPFTPFSIYVIAIDVPGGQEGYEFNVNVDDRVSVTATAFFSRASDFGVDSGNDRNFLVGTGGQCYGDEAGEEVLVSITGLLFGPYEDVEFCLEPAWPSSFNPQRPGYLACNSPGDLRVYGSAYFGCAVANPQSGSGPVIAGDISLRFSASPDPVSPGQTTRISWNVTNVNTVTLEPGYGDVPLSGFVDAVITEDTTFTLSAEGGCGQAERSLDVLVEGLRIDRFEVNPAAISPGAGTYLEWQVQSATDVTISPDLGSVSSAGRQYIEPTAETTYTLTASNAIESASATAAVTWLPPVAELTVSNAFPVVDEVFTLTAEILGADSATLEPGFGSIDPANGTFSTSVSEVTIFTLTATNAKGTTVDEIVVRPRISAEPLGRAGDLGVFFDPTGTLSEIVVQPFEVFAAFVVATDVPGGQTSYEFGLEIDDRLTVVSETIFPAGASDSGLDEAAPGNDRNYLVGTGGCYGQGQDAVLVELGLVVSSAGQEDMRIGLVGATPSSVDPPAPAYTRCREFEHLRYGQLFGVCANVNPGAQPCAPAVFLDASRTDPTFGETIELEARFTGAATATLEPGIGEIEAPGGFFPVQIDEATEFKLTATGPGGTAETSLTVTPVLDCRTARLVLVNYETVSWDPTTLLWEVQVRARNFGPGTAFGMTADLVEEIACVTPVDGQASWGDLPPGETRLGDSFVLDLTGRPGPGSFAVFFDVTYQDNCGDTHRVVLDPEALIPGEDDTAVRQFALLQNYPNPFNPRTVIPFEVKEDGHVRLSIFDMRGRLVKDLVDRYLVATRHTAQWDGTDRSGHAVTAGTYLYRLSRGGELLTRTMTLVR